MKSLQQLFIIFRLYNLTSIAYFKTQHLLKTEKFRRSGSANLKTTKHQLTILFKIYNCFWNDLTYLHIVLTIVYLVRELVSQIRRTDRVWDVFCWQKLRLKLQKTVSIFTPVERKESGHALCRNLVTSDQNPHFISPHCVEYISIPVVSRADLYGWCNSMMQYHDAIV